MNRNFISVFFCVLFTLSCTSLASGLKPYKGDMQATDFSFKDMQGKTHRLSDYRGKAVLLNFWATWCPPSIEELPSLQRLQNHYNNRPFVILTIDIGEPAKTIQPFLQQVGATDLTVLLDEKGSSHQDWNIYVFPTNFLLDQSGDIRFAAVGALNWDEADIIQIIDGLLSQPPG